MAKVIFLIGFSLSIINGCAPSLHLCGVRKYISKGNSKTVCVYIYIYIYTLVNIFITVVSLFLQKKNY